LSGGARMARPFTGGIANMAVFEPIGIVRSNRDKMSEGRWAEVESRIELDPVYAQGLAGLGEFSHVVVVFHLDRIPPFDPAKQLARNPRGMEDLAPVGVFAQRTKFRPNPIGVTAVELVKVGPGGIVVRGLDALDGTPVLDIKPYIPAFERKEDVRLPAWVGRMMDGYF
jgi:tRNA-Thr(GGU) m(6)t(6)A37 methyltransferase TsaA